MKKNKKNNDRWQGYTPADCDCKYCVYYGGKKNGNVICLADACVCSDEIRRAKRPALKRPLYRASRCAKRKRPIK